MSQNRFTGICLCHVNVLLRSLDVGMTKNLGNGRDVGAMIGHVGGHRVPDGMWTQLMCLAEWLQGRPYHITGMSLVEVEESPISMSVLLDVLKESQCFIGCRDYPLLHSFTMNANATVEKVDVGPLQRE